MMKNRHEKIEHDFRGNAKVIKTPFPLKTILMRSQKYGQKVLGVRQTLYYSRVFDEFRYRETAMDDRFDELLEAVVDEADIPPDLAKKVKDRARDFPPWVVL